MCKVHFGMTDFKAERGLTGNPVHPSVLQMKTLGLTNV